MGFLSVHNWRIGENCSRGGGFADLLSIENEKDVKDFRNLSHLDGFEIILWNKWCSIQVNHSFSKAAKYEK